MTVKHYGTEDGTTLVPHDNNPIPVRDNGLGQLLYRYWCRRDALNGLIPADDTPAPDDATLLLKNVRVQSRTVDLVDVELLYKSAASTGWQSQRSDGDISKEARTSTQIVSIDDTRLLTDNGGQYTSDEIAEKKANGERTVPIGGLEYTYTEYDASFDWTEDNLVEDIGRVAESGFIPPGISNGTFDFWMLMGRDIREEGSVTSVGQTWNYSEFGWK